jgi:RNA polymerase sigma-70 factor (ECF subfamily)
MGRDSGGAANGSATFFDQLYTGHRQALHAYFVGRSGDGEVALDLLQEVFLRAWRQRATLQAMPAAEHRFWLFAVARNLVIDHVRRQARRAESTAQLQQQALTAAIVAPNPGVIYERQEQVDLLDQAIQRLPEQLRTVLALHVMGELNSSEMGSVLDMPSGTVRYQLSLARRRLAEDLCLLDGCPDNPVEHPEGMR